MSKNTLLKKLIGIFLLIIPLVLAHAPTQKHSIFEFSTSSDIAIVVLLILFFIGLIISFYLLEKIIVKGIITALVVILLIFSYTKLPKKSPLIGNQEILKEIERIEKLSIIDEQGNSKLTVNDLSTLKELVEGDEIAEADVAELEWLLGHNRSLHIVHSTTYLSDYIKTGKESPCLPHQLWHIGLFIKNNDLEFAQPYITSLDEVYEEWEKSIEKKKKSFPQYYKNVDELKNMMKDAIERLHNQDFSEETILLLEKIGEVGLC